MIGGFIRNQEIKLAMRLLIWRYQKDNLPPPETAALRQQAVRVVEDAHRIAKERGKNVGSLLKEMIEEIRIKK